MLIWHSRLLRDRDRILQLLGRESFCLNGILYEESDSLLPPKFPRVPWDLEPEVKINTSAVCVYISPTSVFCLSQCLFATSQHVCLWDPSKTTSISDNTPRPSHLPLFSKGVWICWAFNNTDLSDSLKTAFQRQRPHTHTQWSIRHSLCVTGLLWNHQACI